MVDLVVEWLEQELDAGSRGEVGAPLAGFRQGRELQLGRKVR